MSRDLCYYVFVDLNEAVQRLHYMTGYKPEKRGYGFMAICPAHEDLRPSLSVFMYKGNLVFNCFGGCAKDKIKDLVVIGAETENKGQITYDTTPFWELKVAKTYNYLNAKGKILYQKVRFIPKSFAIRYKKRNGKWGWGMNGHDPVLYNLPNVIRSRRIIVVEGEKNADAIINLGLTATCNYDGAGKWLDSYNRYLYGKEMWLIPDNDDAGIAHMSLVYEKIHKITRSKIVNLPGLSYKQDPYDWIEMGHTKVEFLKLIGEVVT